MVDYHIAKVSKGWLNVRRANRNDQNLVGLPEYLSIDFTGEVDGRQQFIVKEGVEKGNAFSVRSGYIKAGKPVYLPSAKLKYSKSREILTYQNIEVKAIMSSDYGLKIGSHPIQLPDAPHALGKHYLSDSEYALTWFYIGYGNAVPGDNARYLHCGRVTAGCVTVDPKKWTALYNYLILSRYGDGKTVGSIQVVN